MNKIYLPLALIVSLIFDFKAQSQSVKPYDLVNTFIGTGGHGHTFPGATMPFGMVQLSPDTRLTGWDGCSGYHNTDSVIYGFSHTHLSGTGVSDYGDLLLMPFNYEKQLSLQELKERKHTPSLFKKSSEDAKPGWYKVYLENPQVDVELVTTERVGIHKYLFNKEKNNAVLLDLAHRDEVLDFEINVLDNKTITGKRISKAWATNQQVYFVMEFSQAFNIDEITGGDEKTDLYRILRFDNDVSELQIKVAISAVSIEGARKNLTTEAPHWKFEQYKHEVKTAWEKQLDKIVVSSDELEKKVIFYSALYHTMIAPNLFSDVDGSYRGMDHQIHRSDNTNVYTIFSLWDTFRAAHPLYTIIEQEKTNEFIQTFLFHYQRGGRLPVWELAGNETECMIGYHSVSVIADAFNKGIKNYDVDLAFKAMMHSASLDHFGLKSYRNKGLIETGDEGESVSKTLEYAYDDWCIASMAKQLGKNDIYADYITRAQYYKNIFNPAIGFMQAKMNGGWTKNFMPHEVNFNFTEANSWQYSLFAPHDISGLINLYGGEERFDEQLDNLFDAKVELSGRHQVDITGLIGQYAHGNEPSHHMAYLYNYIGKPWKTQQRIHQILTEQYQNAPDGLSGNEDCGQMSAWYVLSAMGFYSVTPGLDYYTIGTPIMEEVVINLENGNQFKIKANNLSEENKYIQGASLNKKDYSKSYLLHKDIIAGGELVFEMGPSPNTSWGVMREDMPKTEIEEEDVIVVNPIFEAASQSFTDELKIQLNTVESGNTIYYRINGLGSFKKYNAPLSIAETCDIEAYATNGVKKSHVVKAFFKKIDGNRSIAVKTGYSNQYAAGGDKALIDGLVGDNNFKSGYWQGYNNDIVAIVDLGGEESVKKIALGALQDIQSWIFYPTQVQFYVSNDGENFEELITIENSFPDNKYGAFTQQFEYASDEEISTKFVKIVAKNYGLCPEWHLGAGGQTMLFVDELTIE